MNDDTQIAKIASVSGTELQLLVSMLTGLSADVRGGFASVDAKLEKMVPRPEFEAHQKATDLRFAALERSVRESLSDHSTIRAEAETTEAKLAAAVAVVASDVSAAETARLRESKAMNGKLWGMLGGAGLTVGTGVLLAYLNNPS